MENYFNVYFIGAQKKSEGFALTKVKTVKKTNTIVTVFIFKQIFLFFCEPI